MNDNSQTLSCVMIPVGGRQLLLPNVSVAEVVDYGNTDTRAGAPDWLVGYLNWRGLQLPVISYEVANGAEQQPPNHNRGRIVVLNTIGEHHQSTPFMALVTQGIPSQARLSEEQVKHQTAEAGPADLMLVEVEGEKAWIPNLEYLESLAQQSQH